MISSVSSTQKAEPVKKQTSGAKYLKTSSVKSRLMQYVDKFESSDPKVNIKKALKDGSLEYTETTKLFGLITLRKGFYTYRPDKNETVGEIKQKFGIKDNVIKEMNSIDNDDYCPVSNQIYVIYFRLDE